MNGLYISLMLLIPLAASLILLFINNERLIKYFSFAASLLAFIISLLMYFNFDYSVTFNFVEKYSWIKSFNINYHVGVDGLSLLLVLLTNLLMPISILSSYEYIKKDIKKYYIWLLILQSSVNGVFVSLDVFLFYLFWEAMLIPMYFLIGMWGGQNRIYAAVKFFIYTMAGSLLMLASIIAIYVTLKKSGINSFYILDFYKVNISGAIKTFAFISFLVAFAIKIPLFPFHTWLPDAHVEAPTAGSVILAGVLLKMGVYGYMRFLVPIFPELSSKFAVYMAVIGVIGVIYASMMALVQKDIKKLIAYSSVAHMGIIVLGLFSFNHTAVSGAVLQMINHGISTGALFLLVGILYERTHTRLIENYGGIYKTVPYISSVFMIVTLSSIALPPLNGFIGEILILLGAYKVYPVITAVSVSGVILGAVYMLWMYERVFFGKITNEENKKIIDLKIREWIYLLPLIILIFYIGLKPQPFLKLIDSSVSNYIALGSKK